MVLTGDASHIEGMVSFVRRTLGVSAHLGNPHQAALRRSQYSTVAGLLMFSQSDTQDTIVEQDDVERLSLTQRVKRAWSGFNDTLKSIF